jgi:glycine cleavage system protein P-like pyridoxal-binding family
VFEPLHYLALIEQKINALDQAAPLAGWRLPEEFAALRRLLEASTMRSSTAIQRMFDVFSRAGTLPFPKTVRGVRMITRSSSDAMLERFCDVEVPVGVRPAGNSL